MVKFSVATNFDLHFLDEIRRLNRKYSPSEVVEVYGSLPLSLTGSGRSSVGLPTISVHDLADYVELSHSFSLEFNYLMNAPAPRDCYDAEWSKQVHRFINYLKEIGVDSITMTDGLLIRYVEEFQDIPFHVSLITGIDTPEEAKRFSDLGVKLITLNPHTINRNKRKLKEIIDAVNCQIRLYANISCLQNCQMRDEHYVWLGSQSSKAPIDGDQQVDHFILWCENKYMENTVELLRTPFIRPEGLGLYEEIGIDSFKLSDRREPTDSLVRLLEAYMGREYHGNLFSLLFRDDRKWANAIRAITDMESLGHTSIYIDNDKLTELDFDRKVITLSEEELREFYQLATSEAVSGISDSRTRDFHVKLNSVRG